MHALAKKRAYAHYGRDRISKYHYENRIRWSHGERGDAARSALVAYSRARCNVSFARFYLCGRKPCMSGLGKSVIAFPGSGSLNMEQNRASRILLVNDNDDTRELLARTLRKAGYSNLIEARNGAEAVHKLREESIELVITDVHMPQLDGWRLARMVRSGLFACPATTPNIDASATFSARLAETTATM